MDRVYVKIINPKEGDKEHALLVLKYHGTQYAMNFKPRDNMEVVEIERGRCE